MLQSIRGRIGRFLRSSDATLPDSMPNENYVVHTRKKSLLFRDKVKRRKQINQAWDFWLTIIGILITILVTVLGSVDHKIVKSDANNEGRIVTVLFELDAEWVRIAIVCAGGGGGWIAIHYFCIPGQAKVE